MSNLKIVTLLIFSLNLLFNTKNANGQGVLEVFGQIKTEKQDLKGAELRIQEDGGIFQTIKFNSRTGKFDLALPLGHFFTFEFSQEGCITKQIEISTVSPEKYSETVFDPFYFSVQLDLYSESPGVDTLFYDMPVGKVYFEEQYEQFGYDREYILYVQNKINEAVQQQLLATIEKDKNDSILKLQLITDSMLLAQKIAKEEDTIIENIATTAPELLAIKQDTLTSETIINQKVDTPIDSLLAENTRTIEDKPLEEKSITVLTPPVKQIETQNKTPEKPMVVETKTVAPTPVAINAKPAPSTDLSQSIRKVRPELITTTQIPQFKKRPEDKMIENATYQNGLWTRIFINDGSRVYKYTMIQYNNGKTAYYVQDQYQSDSLQISRSLFMRVIN